MVNIVCDTCGATREQDSREPWILGYDLETRSASGVSRAVRFLDRWDERRITELGAIHFCSVQCKDDYLAKAHAA
jgi:hypothetical protein